MGTRGYLVLVLYLQGRECQSQTRNLECITLEILDILYMRDPQTQFPNALLNQRFNLVDPIALDVEGPQDFIPEYHVLDSSYLVTTNSLKPYVPDTEFPQSAV